MEFGSDRGHCVQSGGLEDGATAGVTVTREINQGWSVGGTGMRHVRDTRWHRREQETPSQGITGARSVFIFNLAMPSDAEEGGL